MLSIIKLNICWLVWHSESYIYILIPYTSFRLHNCLCCFERFLCKFPFPLKVALMLEYKLLSNNYCKHSKTVIKIKLPNVKCHSLKCSLKKHLNNQKGTHESILCSQGIHKCKWTAIILGFLSVDSDVNISLTKSNKLYVWLTSWNTLENLAIISVYTHTSR